MAHVLVFDSGVGGLSVVTELRALLPDLHIDYVADDDFRPYGDKTAPQLKQRLPALIQTLVLMIKPDIVVLACNTASTTALSEIRKVVDMPVVGVVPAVKPAALFSKTKTIAILGTPGTVARRYVGNLIDDFAQDCQVILHGSTRLVELAERELAGGVVGSAEIETELQPMFSHKFGKDIDVVVLACTHFPLLLNALKSTSPHGINWIDSGQAIAIRTQSLLIGKETSPLPNYPQTAFLIGGAASSMRAKMFAEYGFAKTVILPA